MSTPRRVKVATMLPSFLPPHRQIQVGRFLEALGFDHLWLPDHMLFPEGGPAYDSWSLLGPLATATGRVGLGPAVTDPHRTHPAVLAQRLATLDQLSRGRMILGLGSGEAMNLEPYGIPWRERKVRKVSEFLSVVRGLLDSREPFTFEGDFFTLRKARLKVRPYQDRHIPIYMAALGPMMQKLAGKKVEGWLPTPIPAEYYQEYFAPLAESARSHGRDPDTIAKVASVVACVDTDGRTSLGEVTRILRPLSAIFVWGPVMRRMGFDFEPPEDARVSYMEVDPCDEASMEAYWNYQRWLPEEMLERAVTYGSIDEVTEQCRRYVDVGADHLYLFFGSPDPLGSIILFAHRALPRLTGRPPTPLARLLGALLTPLISRGLLKRHFPAPVVKMPAPRGSVD